MSPRAPKALFVLILSGTVLTALGIAGEAPAADNSTPDTNAASVGVARMLPNGNILVGIAGPNAQAQAVLILEPGDSNYQPMIDHLGGLQPGETKSIPPWPSKPPAPPSVQPENMSPSPQR